MLWKQPLAQHYVKIMCIGPDNHQSLPKSRLPVSSMIMWHSLPERLKLQLTYLSTAQQWKVQLCTVINGPGWTDPLVAPVVKTLKLAIYLFLDFNFKFGFKSIVLVHWHSISNQQGQKYGQVFVYIPSNGGNEGVNLPRAYWCWEICWSYFKLEFWALVDYLVHPHGSISY
jgi:hypothetical protein